MCDQEEIWIGFGIGGGFYVVDYFVLCDDFFVGMVIIVFGVDLVFNMVGGCICFDQ